MRTLWLGLLACAVGTAAAAADSVPGEVPVHTPADAKKACAARGPSPVYVMTIPSVGFELLPYDAPRARLVIDSARGFRGGAGVEAVLHDLGGGRVPPGTPELEIAVPSSPAEAKALIVSHKSGSLDLTVWFHVASPADKAPACATVHRIGDDSLRMAIEPLAFVLKKGRDPIASGELPSFAAQHGAEAPVITPRVVVSAPFLTGQAGRAPQPIAKVAAALEPPLLGCYRRGLLIDPTLRGSLVAGVDITVDGKVAAARAEIDGLAAPEVVKCALDAVKGAKFPKGSNRISIPIEFTD
jgi:hypothetical protein